MACHVAFGGFTFNLLRSLTFKNSDAPKTGFHWRRSMLNLVVQGTPIDSVYVNNKIFSGDLVLIIVFEKRSDMKFKSFRK